MPTLQRRREVSGADAGRREGAVTKPPKVGDRVRLKRGRKVATVIRLCGGTFCGNKGCKWASLKPTLSRFTYEAPDDLVRVPARKARKR